MVKDILSYDRIFSSLMTMSEYYSQRMSEYKVKIKDKSRLLTDINDLISLDFRNTLNYSTLNDLRLGIIEAEDDAKIADIYNEAKSAFPNCLIIPIKDFHKILIDNDLVIRPSSFFIGSIPVDTLDKIKNHLNTVRSWEFRTEINNKLLQLDKPVKYGRVTLFRYELNLLFKELDKTGGICKNMQDLFYNVMRNNNYSKSSSEKIWKFINRNISESFSNVSFNNVIIACPKSMSSPIYIRDDSVYDLKRDQERLRKSQAMDPIVFQFTPAGVLVIDSWGKESHDQILLEHKDRLNLNNQS